MPLETPYRPTDELVGVSWLRQRANLEGIVATSLPKDSTPEGLSWRASGFVTARSIDANLAPIDLATNAPVLQLDFWAAPASPGSSAPQWNLAAGLAAQVRHYLDNEVQKFMAPVTLPAGYLPAVVRSVYQTTTPRRIENDPSAYARITFDAIFDWVEA